MHLFDAPASPNLHRGSMASIDARFSNRFDSGLDSTQAYYGVLHYNMSTVAGGFNGAFWWYMVHFQKIKKKINKSTKKNCFVALGKFQI